MKFDLVIDLCKKGNDYRNKAIDAYGNGYLHTTLGHLNEEIDIMKSALEKVGSQSGSVNDLYDYIISDLAFAYYLRASVRWQIDEKPGDLILSDCCKALDLDGQKILRDPEIDSLMRYLFGFAVEAYYYTGHYKKGLMVCRYIERYFDPDIVNLKEYKSIKREWEGGEWGSLRVFVDEFPSESLEVALNILQLIADINSFFNS